jgi:S1-C subfamily serine protease
MQMHKNGPLSGKGRRGRSYLLIPIQQKRDGTDRVEFRSTGFVISNSGYGYGITVAHAVPAETAETQVEYYASVASRYSNKFPVHVVKRDPELDLALLSFPDVQEWTPIDIGESNRVPDDARLYVLGFPRSSDLSSAEGLLSSHFGRHGNWQTTLPLDYGDSGGPVFDIGGRVIAIAAGGLDDARAITYVIPIRYARPLLELAQIESLTRYAKVSPNVGAEATIKKSFAFSVTADHQETKNVDEDFCLPNGMKITSYQPIVASKAGSATRVISFAKVPDKPNCLRFRATVAGNGGRVEEGRGCLGHAATPRFPSPLIKPGRADFPHPAFRPVSP